jgi:hypothetical protein
VISISVYFDLKHGKSSLDNSNLSTPLTVCSGCHTYWHEGGFNVNVKVRYRKELVLKPDVETFKENTARSRDEYERIDGMSLSLL